MNIKSDDYALCPGCGLVSSAGDDVAACWINGCGIALRYYPEDECAAIVNALNRAGYTVNRFKFPNEYNSNREIEIEFVGQCDFTLTPPPEGFACESGVRVKVGLNVENIPDEGRYDYYSQTPTFIYKRYPKSMPPMQYARQLLLDKLALLDWIYSHPYMRQLLNN